MASRSCSATERAICRIETVLPTPWIPPTRTRSSTWRPPLRYSSSGVKPVAAGFNVAENPSRIRESSMEATSAKATGGSTEMG